MSMIFRSFIVFLANRVADAIEAFWRAYNTRDR